MSKSILLVEDDATIARMYVQKFEQAGFEVTHAIDAQAALTALIDEKFDILLIDILLPKINGLQLIKEIRKDHRQDKTPIVIITNLLPAELQLKDEVKKSLGISALYVKAQISPTELVTQIKALLQLKDS
jgi:two-component system alkaline phosphatase synthesis response regulator PhoP